MVLLATLAVAQSPQWLASPGRGFSGVGGTVYSTVEWDADGTGPGASLLIVGGQFAMAGNELASNIAMWDGAQWHALGGGVDDTVCSLCIYQGGLYVGGAFHTAGGAGGVLTPGIARWDGHAWNSVGGGVTLSSPTSRGVTGLSVYQGNLLVAGSLSAAGGVAVQNIAMWNGASWSPYGSVVSGLDTFAELDGQLFATGNGVRGVQIRDQAGVWRLDSANHWDPGNLAIVDGSLIAVASNNYSGVQDNSWLRWTGAGWESTNWDGLSNPINNLKYFGGTAYASFVDLTNYNPGGVATLGGTRWSRTYYSPGVPEALGEFQGDLVAAGSFHFIDEIASEGVAVLHQGEWQHLGHGLGSDPWWMYWIDGTLRVPTSIEASPTYYRKVMKLGDEGWEEDLSVYARPEYFSGIIEYHGDRYVVGSLVPTPGTSSSLCRIDESNNLIPVPLAPTPTDAASISGLIYHDEIVVVCNGISSWNGTDWTIIAPNPGPNVHVAVVGDDLVAFGLFPSIGGVNSSHIARWDGTQWHAFTDPAPIVVSYVTGLGNSIYFTGQMTSGGHWGVWVWTGAAWSMIGDVGANNFSNPITGLVSFDGDLYAAGSFTSISGVPAKRVARWNGSVWSPLGPGLNNSVISMATNGEVLAFVGNFTQIGSEVAANFALWGFPPTPVCIGDFNHDGGVDGSDVPAFFAAWEMGDSAADLNGDGGIDGGDVQVFFAAWEAGC